MNTVTRQVIRDADEQKANGAHYTPNNLAQFVADQIVSTFSPEKIAPVRVLDPACGDGELLVALVRQMCAAGYRNIIVDGFDTNAVAVSTATNRLVAESEAFGIELISNIRNQDFLENVLDNSDSVSRDSNSSYDLVIANPPYVRTQVLGSRVAQRLAEQFDLNGRVDLYFAFLISIANVLQPGGIVGIIVSNRFMTTKSGAPVRAQIREQFDVQHVWDLGDTKIFSAAVLPAVLLMSRKRNQTTDSPARFTSIYSCNDHGSAKTCETVFDALQENGVVNLGDDRQFFVSHGSLADAESPDEVWCMSNEKSIDWLATVSENTWATFADIGKVHVGVKTTADKVFIRDDWEQVCPDGKPELLRPLVTHAVARRFRADQGRAAGKEILYTHEVRDGKRIPVDLTQFPLSCSYLELHKASLTARKYVQQANRKWYEIWVPHDPDCWEKPKLVWRDICERPVFWFDEGGSVINGDCYWLACLNPGDEPLLWLALAVGNSTFIERFYDYRFNNKLYAGRRRFISQYVNSFPIPDPSTPIAEEMIRLAKQLCDKAGLDTVAMELRLNQMVWQSFGLSFQG